MIEQIKKDRGGGVSGPWVWVPNASTWQGNGKITPSDYLKDCGGFSGGNGEIVCWFGNAEDYYPIEGIEPNEADVRRIARLPELEEYALEAHELLKEVLAGACVNCAYIAPRNIERIKKLVGEA